MTHLGSRTAYCVLHLSAVPMAPKKGKPKVTAKAKPPPPCSIDAASLQKLHGDLLRVPPYSECPSPFLLHKALHGRTPAIGVSMGVVKHWWTLHRNVGQGDIVSADTLNEKHGDTIMSLV